MTFSAKRSKSLEDTDALPPELRECVHEFGLPIVSACAKHGVKSKAAIRELVREIWDGARQTGQSNSAYGTLDWLLIQHGANISAKTLYRVLAEHSLVITTVEPTRSMLAASMAEVSGFTVRCTREEKHRRRLRAALRASINSMLNFGVRPLNPKPSKEAA
jgi:hypothetical protein